MDAAEHHRDIQLVFNIAGHPAGPAVGAGVNRECYQVGLLPFDGSKHLPAAAEHLLKHRDMEHVVFGTKDSRIVSQSCPVTCLLHYRRQILNAQVLPSEMYENNVHLNLAIFR